MTSNENQHHHSNQQKSRNPMIEELTVSGDMLIGKVKELIHEGNIRRIYVKNEEGKTLIEIPLTFGVMGTLLLPVGAALGALGALIANFTLGIERYDDEDTSSNMAQRSQPLKTDSVRDHVATHSDHPSEGQS